MFFLTGATFAQTIEKKIFRMCVFQAVSIFSKEPIPDLIHLKI